MRDEHTPSFKELLEDPIIVAVMQRDGVSKSYLSSLMTAMRERLSTLPGRLAA